ncbi:hypothetical protein [Tractidigestivibacter sp.]|uniref:hypothetical protein n=1 Tax=Tractidigestivibacter sp. TaxID=2847320 RepID=UPI002A81EB97|nr:hypothetical protein [Tractidigestivibacter sp.]MCI6274236.1 hypothetical protein [Coriobacteriaceae bacterium]MDD7583694.1 hypothetical protein [Coriobacteriaceae bacterium]MDY4534814.1 hypothetical protein [Tractidigestivibacter sp.]MDY5272360.1 hypothetical protein [Tractidigestivibacter sp.]
MNVGSERGKGYGFRIASVVLGLLAVVVLGGLWFANETELLFVPLLIATAGVFCLGKFRRING